MPGCHEPREQATLALEQVAMRHIAAAQQLHRGLQAGRHDAFSAVHRTHAAAPQALEQFPVADSEAAPIRGRRRGGGSRDRTDVGQRIGLQRTAQVGDQVRMDFGAKREKNVRAARLRVPARDRSAVPGA